MLALTASWSIDRTIHKDWAEIAEHWVTVLALFAGGGWVLYQYVIRRSEATALSISVSNQVSEYADDRRLVFVDVVLRNTGLISLEASTKTSDEIFREYGDWGFSVSSKDRSKFVPRGLNTASKERGELTVVDAARLEWLPNIYEGDTQRYLKLKPLYHDPAPPGNPRKGFVTMLCWAPPGWSDARMVHHPVFE